MRDLVIHKARNAGDFTINFMHAAFNVATFSGEIFIEFQETIRVCTLNSQLEARGACQVTVLTFNVGDANESASNALLRVWMSAEKTGCQFQRGTVSRELFDKTQTKFDRDKQKQAESSKEDAKDHIDGKVEHTQQGVCTIIPDYQKLLRESTEKLAHKTKEVDRIESKMGRMTQHINKLTTDNETLRESCNVMVRKHERDILEYTNALATKEKQLKDKDEMLDVYRVLDNVKHLMELDRAAKQARKEN